MADRGDTHYHLPNLNAWFALSSVLLLATTLWMVVDDWSRPWKQYQREFRRIEAGRLEEALASPEYVAMAEVAETHRLALQEALVAQDRRKADIQALEKKRDDAGARLFVATERAKSLKEDLNFRVFQIEEHRIHHDDPTFGQEQLRRLQQGLLDAELDQERVEFEIRDVEAQLSELRRDVADAQSRLKAATRDLKLMQSRLERLAPRRVTERVANVIRDAPMADFIDPSLKVHKVVLANLTNDLNFTVKSRIDMCHTCHLAIDREGFTEEGLAQPFRSHPRLDLYLSPTSPHPLNDVGCTICHRGAGEALHFVRADHRPMSDPALPMGGGDWERWQKEYHWHKQHHWDWPMLTTEYVEAGCVQCHKTSMELIADDAPRVTEGYRLFERYGCYSCHKVDWFPTSRKPGPTLANWKTKFRHDWMASWIAHPKAFRPTTWMPQIFHLENFAPEQSVAVSEYGRGREILGGEWNDAAVASIVAFLDERVPERRLASIPVSGDAERGREVFRVSGCLACHNMEPYPGREAEAHDPAFVRTGENEKGPNLRGVATKVSAEWLYHWIKDPHRYWNETLMPDLRLSDQDAADVTAYLMEDPDGVFTDVPEGWQVAAAQYDMDVLREQARWLYRRDGADVIQSRFEGKDAARRWDDPRELLVAVGERLVSHHGCYSCHEIPGLETTMPIGVELSNWGSKTVDKLDWGFVADLFAKEHGWSLPQREEYRAFREHWLEQKLHRPRSFDLEKVKNPLDRLRMPEFGFGQDEIKALATFVVGLVDDEVERAKMRPTPAQAAMDQGLRVIRQKNCLACHAVDPGSVTFRRAGQELTVRAELLPIGDDSVPPRQEDLAALLEAIRGYQEHYDEEVEEIGFRLLEVAPGVGLPGENVFVAPDELVAITPPAGGDFVRTVVDYYLHGIELHDPEPEDPADPYYAWNLGEGGEVEDVDGVLRPYFDEEYEKIRWTFAPPVLYDQGYKVQRNWFHAFLTDPVPLRKQMRVRMPTFRYRPGEAEAVADYFAHKSEMEWPARYARRLRFALGMELPEGAAEQGLAWPRAAARRTGGTGLTIDELMAIAAEHPESAALKASTVEGIERGSRHDIEAGFERLLALGRVTGFRMSPPVRAHSQIVRRRAPSHLAERAPFIELGGRLATDPSAVNCYQCHWHGGIAPEQAGAPLAWAPDLSLTYERLREDWAEDWLWNPAYIYPGTSMPANFTGDPPQFQEHFPGSDNEQQIQAVLDWLFNFDRVETLTRN